MQQRMTDGDDISDRLWKDADKMEFPANFYDVVYRSARQSDVKKEKINV